MRERFAKVHDAVRGLAGSHWTQPRRRVDSEMSERQQRAVLNSPCCKVASLHRGARMLHEARQVCFEPSTETKVRNQK